MRDVLDQEIQVGAIIAYPDRRGSQMWLNTGEVLKVMNDGVHVRAIEHAPWGSYPKSKTSIVRTFDRIVVVRRAPTAMSQPA